MTSLPIAPKLLQQLTFGLIKVGSQLVHAFHETSLGTTIKDKEPGRPQAWIRRSGIELP